MFEFRFGTSWLAYGEHVRAPLGLIRMHSPKAMATASHGLGHILDPPTAA